MIRLKSRADQKHSIRENISNLNGKTKESNKIRTITLFYTFQADLAVHEFTAIRR
jgi:hypothetical protein